MGGDSGRKLDHGGASPQKIEVLLLGELGLSGLDSVLEEWVVKKPRTLSSL